MKCPECGGNNAFEEVQYDECTASYECADCGHTWDQVDEQAYEALQGNCGDDTE